MGTKEELFVSPKADGSSYDSKKISQELYHFSYLKKRYDKMQASLKEFKTKRKKERTWLVLIRQAIYTDIENGPKFKEFCDYFRVLDEKEFEENNLRMSGNMIFCEDFPVGLLFDIVTDGEFEEKYAHLAMLKEEQAEREIEQGKFNIRE